MLLTYVDESYTAAWYWMGALLVPAEQAMPLTEALDQVVAAAGEAHGVPAGAELHGYDLHGGHGPWKGLPPRARAAVYRAALQAIGGHEVAIILRGVCRAGLARRYGADGRPVHEVVLSHLLERVDGYAARQEQWALVIADEVDGQSVHRADLGRYRLAGTGGYRSRRIGRIVDTLHFAPSHASRLVQAADLVTFLHRRMQTVTEADRRAAALNAALWGEVEKRVYHSRCWFPVPGMHEGPALGGA